MSEKKIAVVTGGNRGIGKEIARQLVEGAFTVFLCARNPNEARMAAQEVGAEPATLDVTKADDIAALDALLKSGFDVLVNNAGVSLTGFDADVARRTLAANFFGAMRVTDRVLPRLRAGGRIVMVSSGMGVLSPFGARLRERFVDPALTREALSSLVESFVEDVRRGVHAERGWPTSAYRVSKAAMNAYTRLLARELEADPRKILVNAADPGWVKTRMGGEGAPRSVEEGARTPVWLATLPAGGSKGPSGGFFRDERAQDF